MMTVTALQHLIQTDLIRMRMLAQVRALALPDCWIGAGFVRNAVWDSLHHRSPSAPSGDVDVIWHNPGHGGEAIDRALEASLRGADSAVDWSVKNQARMHQANRDPAYASAIDAMRYWPETATAVAVRLGVGDIVEVAAPYGLHDLFDGVLRPTPAFTGARRAIFDARCQGKQWLLKWPRLRLELI